MYIIKGNDRSQISFFCLEDRIEEDNPVGFVELFVE